MAVAATILHVNANDFLQSVEDRLRNLIERAKAATRGLTQEQLNKEPEPSVWSVAQVFEHLLLANRPYVTLMEDILQTGTPKGNGEISHSWLGKFIISAAGPGGNAPPPKPMIPASGPYTEKVVKDWVDQQDKFLALIAQFKGSDVAKIRFRNPFIKLFKMNLADALEILAVHTERHVGQIEERAAKARRA